MLQLKNNTPFAADIALFPNEDGIDTLYTIVKAGFKIGAEWTLAEEQDPPQKEDLYWGEPVESSLKYASDYHTGKAATDIIVLGSACAIEQQEVRQLDVTLQVADVQKGIRVFGDRVWQNGRPSQPEAFQVMPLVYERAFGGQYSSDEKIVAEERNPVGCSFLGKRSANELEGKPLPNLEDPNNLIQQPKDTPEPACFGFKSPNWKPRAVHAGTFDERWQQTRAPYLPVDYSPYFLNAAHPDLIYPGFLVGGEPVRITNMHPNGELNFNLPFVKLSAKMVSSQVVDTTDFCLETVILKPNKLEVSMVWRSAYICDKRALKIDEVQLGLSR